MENHSGIWEVMYEYFCIVPGEVGGGGEGDSSLVLGLGSLGYSYSGGVIGMVARESASLG